MQNEECKIMLKSSFYSDIDIRNINNNKQNLEMGVLSIKNKDDDND